MPVARSAVLLGRTLADLVRNVLIIGLMIVVGYLVGFRFHGGFAGAVGCIAIVSAFGLGLSWIFALVALTVRGAEAAQSAGFVVTFPLVFASSVFVPISTLPGWLQAITKVSPVTLTANAARSLALTGTPTSLLGALAWIVGLLAVFVPLSVRRYRRILSLRPEDASAIDFPSSLIRVNSSRTQGNARALGRYSDWNSFR